MKQEEIDKQNAIHQILLDAFNILEKINIRLGNIENQIREIDYNKNKVRAIEELLDIE